MPNLDAAVADLKRTLGDFLDRNRADGVFYVQVGGPGSLPALAELDVPEIHLDVLPLPMTTAQQDATRQLGYVPESAETWLHPGGWRLVISDHGSGWRAEQGILRELLMNDSAAVQQYRQVFLQDGRAKADAALRVPSREYYALNAWKNDVQLIAQTLAPLDTPWMFAAGVALDLHLGRVNRPHDDIDVVVSRETQPQLRELLADWRTDAPLNGTYQAWNAPLEPPQHQLHARHSKLQGVIMLDVLLTNLSAGLWHYRRDPRITLPLAQARRVNPDGLPYLTPEAVLLFKASTGGKDPRGKDSRDFADVLPTLDEQARNWLRHALEVTQPGHGWIEALGEAG